MDDVPDVFLIAAGTVILIGMWFLVLFTVHTIRIGKMRRNRRGENFEVFKAFFKNKGASESTLRNVYDVFSQRNKIVKPFPVRATDDLRIIYGADDADELIRLAKACGCTDIRTTDIQKLILTVADVVWLVEQSKEED